MNKCFWGALLVTLACTALAGADVITSIGDHFVDESIDSYDVPVLISLAPGSGPEVLTDVNVGIDSGGGDPTAPQVTAIVAGAIFAGHNVTEFSSTPLPDRMVDLNVVLNTPGDTVEVLPAEQELVVFTLDLTPYSEGDTFDLAHWYPPLLFNSSQQLAVQTIDGSITITPEPGTLVLSTIGLLFGLAWMGRRRKSKA